MNIFRFSAGELNSQSVVRVDAFPLLYTDVGRQHTDTEDERIDALLR